MTNPDLTLIAVLVDRSGSMSSMRTQMERALNEYFEGQAKEPGKAVVTLAQFDDKYELVHSNVPIKDIEAYTLHPRGSTALNDGIGKLVTDVGTELSKLAEKKRPSKVIVVIVTDGHENASREWSVDGIKTLIAEQTNTYSWEFIFLGANIDAQKVAGDYGIRLDAALDFSPATAGVAMNSMASYTTTLRSTGVASFTESDRARAMGK